MDTPMPLDQKSDTHPARRLIATLLAVAAFAALPVAQAATPLADQPLFTNISVPGNLALVLSVEFPTAISAAYSDTNGYASANVYLGYFDPNKCYLYHYESTEANRYFYPAGLAVGHTCTGADDAKWSGNFLNWATMQTIDAFRWALTGGYRVVDTASTTYLEKAWGSNQGSNSNFNNKSLSSSTTIAQATPFSTSAFSMQIWSLGNQMRFSAGTLGSTVTNFDPSTTFNSSKTYTVSVRVKVCDPSTAAGGLEANCKAYSGGNYKPEGLLQQYSNRIRYSAFGYLNDSNLQRDAGVLRARQAFIGPTQPVPGSANISNPNAEWDPTTGVFVGNPDASDASATSAMFGVTVGNSGVMNYLNMFGENSQSYKTYDPVSELYYAAIRYLKNLGNVGAWTTMTGASTATKTTWIDGFPVITSWNDPIQYSCQKNFILGIGDVNTHADKNVPGATPTANEPTKPAEVSSDPSTSNGHDAVSMTNKIGVIEGLGSSLGTVNPYNGCCNNNSTLMAGLAYDAHTNDIRPDLTGKQTIDTYWLDVQEYGVYKSNNQFYLATKYGGFAIPAGFDSMTNTAALPQAWWSTSGDTLGSPAQPRPDNYYSASRADLMVAGLTKAFANIAAALKAYTTSFSTSLPQVSVSNNRSYAAQYDSQNWTGEVVASSLSFDPVTGNPSQTLAWKLTDKLAVQLAGSGWDSGRLMMTWNTASSAGVPFRIASLSTAQKTALDPSYVSGDDSANYLNYLRGQQTNEAASTDSTSTHAYRTRTKLLGDVVGSRVRPVGPPSLILSDSTNPGYASFKSTWSARPTMVYFGSNDGMMHAVNGELTGSSAGDEVFAYVPSAVINGPSGTPSVDGLAALGNPSFVHHNYVNATPNVYDIDFGKTQGGSGTAWHSVLIGGLGKGGKSYYAIDVTDPSAFSSESTAATKVLWEFSDPDLGYTYGDPVVVKTKRWGWVAVFVSGYNNADGKGYFFIVNPRTGALLQKVSTGVGSTSGDAGLAQANGFVLDRTDGTADAIYAGDLLGNVWRLDVTAASSDYPAPTLIAQLKDASNNPQPITTRPLIEVQPGTNRRFVLVGAGRLLDTTDIGSTQAQSYWAFRDGSGARFTDSASLPSGVSFPLKRSDMLANTDPLVGVTFNDPKQMGWVLDLGSGSGSIGWRVVTDSTAFNGAVAFASTLPSGDACNPTGSSRIYSIDFGSGKSVLTTTTTDSSGATTTVPIVYSTATTSVVTDLRFFSVDGQARLIGGSDTGDLKSIQGNFTGNSGLRRLNWRELPTPE
jgi:type IV pilus assembly protein PilY1